jgi:hypothetical protein
MSIYRMDSGTDGGRVRLKHHLILAARRNRLSYAVTAPPWAGRR